MNSSTVVLLLTVFLVALSISTSVVNAGEEKEEKESKESGEKKEEKKEEKEAKEGKEDKKEGSGESGEKDSKGGAMSMYCTSALSTVISLTLFSVIMSIH